VRIFVVEGKDEALFLKLFIERYKIVDYTEREKKEMKKSQERIIARYDRISLKFEEELIKVEGGITKIHKFLRKYIGEGQLANIQHQITLFIFCDDEKGTTKLIEEFVDSGNLKVKEKKPIKNKFKLIFSEAYGKKITFIISIPNLDEVVKSVIKKDLKKEREKGEEREKEIFQELIDKLECRQKFENLFSNSNNFFIS
jgi:hypothetical protein